MFSPTEEILDRVGWRKFRLCFAAVEETDVDSCSHRVVEGITNFWKIRKVEDLGEVLKMGEEGAVREEGVRDLGGMQFC